MATTTGSWGLGFAMRLLSDAHEAHPHRALTAPTMGQNAKRAVYHCGGIARKRHMPNLAEAEMDEASGDLKPLYHPLNGAVK